MTPQQYADAHSPNVTSLHATGDPEQDHLIEEVKHPDLTEAFQAMACRACGRPFEAETPA